MKTLRLLILVGAGAASASVFGMAALLFPQLFHFGYHEGTENSGSQLALAMSINSTSIRPGQVMGVDISLANTSPDKLVVDPQHNWPLRKWSMGPCLFHMPFGMALMPGNYSVENMTEGQRLPLYPSGVYVCKTIGIVDFVFEPSSSKATVETYNSTKYPVTMQYHVAFNGFYDGKEFHPLDAGAYTVVGEDQWGHVVLHHFTVDAGS